MTVTSHMQSLFPSRGSITTDCMTVTGKPAPGWLLEITSALSITEPDSIHTYYRADNVQRSLKEVWTASLGAGTNIDAGPRQIGQYRPRLARQVPHKYFHSSYIPSRTFSLLLAPSTS